MRRFSSAEAMQQPFWASVSLGLAVVAAGLAAGRPTVGNSMPWVLPSLTYDGKTTRNN